MSLPGGGVDISDNSLSWKSVFNSHKIAIENLESHSKKPLIYQSRSHQLPRETSLRITTIRETFEEVGIILYKNSLNSSNFSSYFHSKNCDIPTWQHKIHNKHETLMSFYDQHDLIPDIFKLYEWSVWLTPTFSKKRYEAAFFIAALENIPPVYSETNEVQSFSVSDIKKGLDTLDLFLTFLKWETPDKLLEKHRNKQIWLPPPIFYELHRFLNQTKIDDIMNFAANRNGKEVPLIFPIPYYLKDGTTLIYPGDDLYPENPNLYETVHDLQKFENFTYEELAKNCDKFCRIEMKNMYATNFMCNITDGLLAINTHIPNSKL